MNLERGEDKEEAGRARQGMSGHLGWQRMALTWALIWAVMAVMRSLCAALSEAPRSSAWRRGGGGGGGGDGGAEAQRLPVPLPGSLMKTEIPARLCSFSPLTPTLRQRLLHIAPM